ncbi:EAL domain-containing protein [Pantanalinema rosaneae CENA516]|uniref:EAL domain-containing protein n=1 Tax=Pantanalinema rosaneae TaxID=1620701 RepID=UPI003D6EDFD8
MGSILTHPVLVTSVLVAGSVLGIRNLGGLQPLELLAFDQMVRLRSEAAADPRLLVVAITEEDIRTQNQWPMSDAVFARLLANLQRYQPRVIGLDIYRDVPTQPGRSELLAQLQADNVITIKSLGDAEDSKVPPPPGIPPERVGFSDIVLDPDTVVRRNLLYASKGTEKLYSFSLRLSLRYLSNEKLAFQATPDYLKIGDTVFPPLDRDSGGYQSIDDGGYQVLLNYHSASDIARQVTLTQVLTDRVDPAWIKDKIIVVGTTAPSVKDLFLTPYNLSANQSPKMPGVLVHTQMVSQILSTVLDGRPLFWFWAQAGEMLWIVAWSVAGGVLAWWFRHPLALGVAMIASVGGLFGICLGIFSAAGWIPLVPAAIALVASSIGVIVWKLLHDALHDSLTGLPNRTLFIQHLQWAIASDRHLLGWFNYREPPSTAVLLLGLDSFKTINDSFGHRLGDQLIATFAHRLRHCLRSQTQLARVGGDEFAVLLRDIRDAEEVMHLADQIQRQVTKPFSLNGQEVFATASIGMVLDCADSQAHPEDILRDAHTAMQQAKASGKARYQLFVAGMRDQVMTRLQLETDLRRAIERQEFRLHYQPFISLETGKIAGFEALARWQHPQRGFVHPAEFIPVAEETDLIIPMGRWIIHEACQQLKTWQQQFPMEPPLLVSVNLSGKQFPQPDLVEQIEQTLHDTGLDGRCLKLEITESIAMTDVEATIALLLRLKELNLQLSIDDFGTGYSSLSYLHRFPTDTIKVDRSFVSRMGDESEDAHIVQTIVMLGHNLGMDIVAEGVETAEQLARLRALKCEYAQGYFFAKPLSCDAIATLLKSDPHW